jgi:hypothetical protein
MIEGTSESFRRRHLFRVDTMRQLRKGQDDAGQTGEALCSTEYAPCVLYDQQALQAQGFIIRITDLPRCRLCVRNAASPPSPKDAHEPDGPGPHP